MELNQQEPPKPAAIQDPYLPRILALLGKLAGMVIAAAIAISMNAAVSAQSAPTATEASFAQLWRFVLFLAAASAVAAVVGSLAKMAYPAVERFFIRRFPGPRLAFFFLFACALLLGVGLETAGRQSYEAFVYAGGMMSLWLISLHSKFGPGFTQRQRELSLQAAADRRVTNADLGYQLAVLIDREGAAKQTLAPKDHRAASDPYGEAYESGSTLRAAWGRYWTENQAGASSQLRVSPGGPKMGSRATLATNHMHYHMVHDSTRGSCAAR